MTIFCVTKYFSAKVTKFVPIVRYIQKMFISKHILALKTLTFVHEKLVHSFHTRSIHSILSASHTMNQHSSAKTWAVQNSVTISNHHQRQRVSVLPLKYLEQSSHTGNKSHSGNVTRRIAGGASYIKENRSTRKAESMKERDIALQQEKKTMNRLPLKRSPPIYKLKSRVYSQSKFDFTRGHYTRVWMASSRISRVEFDPRNFRGFIY